MTLKQLQTKMVAKYRGMLEAVLEGDGTKAYKLGMARDCPACSYTKNDCTSCPVYKAEGRTCLSGLPNKDYPYSQLEDVRIKMAHNSNGWQDDAVTFLLARIMWWETDAKIADEMPTREE